MKDAPGLDLERPAGSWPPAPALQGSVWHWWEGRAGLPGRLLSTLAWPLELLFRLGVLLRASGHRMGLLRARAAPIPVVSVGNLAVGGTGKTPLAGWIVGHLDEAGLRPALVARGYGADELELHRRWNPAAPVYAARRRIHGVGAAANAGARVAVLDDGFQHRALARDLDVVLLAAEHPFPPRLLPRGPYREPLRALRRADLVVVTRRTAGVKEADRLEAAVRRRAPDTPVVRVRLGPRDWTDLEGTPGEAPRGPVLALASVARPGDFGRMVRGELGSEVELAALPDHHLYTPDDVEEIVRRADDRTLVTTEKDAVKLAPFRDRLGATRVLRLRVVFEREGEELSRALARLAGEEK